MRLQKKLPDLKKALDTVILLLSKQARGGGAPTPARAAPEAWPHRPVQASSEATGVEFQLTDNIFAKVSSRLCARICRGPERAPPAPQAVLQDTRTVCLWLGANVMLEYSLEEARSPSTEPRAPQRACASLCALTPCASHMATQAEQLLTRNHANALSSLEAVKAEVLSVRDSITTTEARNALR